MSKKDLSAKVDGWSNILTGLGIMGKDKRMSANFVYNPTDKNTVEQLYGCDDMAEKVVDYLPEEMQREGWELSYSVENENLDATIKEKIKEMDGFVAIDQALKWARLYGGAGIVLGVQDGRDPSEPVNESAIKTVDFMNTLHRWELHPQSTGLQRNPTEPNFGMPTLYQLNPEVGGGPNSTILVHESRVLRFEGARLPRNLFIANSYWHDSVLNRFFNPLRNFQSAHDASASLLQDFAQAVYKIKNLTEMMETQRDDLVAKRLSLVDRTRSIVGAIVMEEGEDFDRKVTSLGGLPELLSKIEQRLVQASKMPHTVMLGESASGLGATGESEKRDFYDYVARQQEVNLKPQLTKLYRYLLLSRNGPTGGRQPETWSVRFKPLWQMDQKQEAEIKKINADTDQIYIQNGVIDPDEVAISRFGNDDAEITVDLSLRKDPARDPSSIEEVATATEPLELMPNKSGEETKKVVLNGAQITAIVDLIKSVSLGELPRQTAIELIVEGFSMDKITAERIFGEVGRGFKPEMPSEKVDQQELDQEGLDVSVNASEVKLTEIPVSDAMVDESFTAMEALKSSGAKLSPNQVLRYDEIHSGSISLETLTKILESEEGSNEFKLYGGDVARDYCQRVFNAIKKAQK